MRAFPISFRTQTPGEAEEVEAVLSSQTFSEAPNLSRLLRYLCSNHFSETPSSLNEYRIAVEAMGRPADFDPARNSSVRVEMHRLRVRLRKYYETEGADHALRILLMEGRYGLQFVRREIGATLAATEVNEPSAPIEEPTTASNPQPGSPDPPAPVGVEPAEPAKARIQIPSLKFMAAAAAIVLVLCLGVWLRLKGPSQEVAQPSNASAGTLAAASPTGTSEDGAVLILAGYPKEKYIDREGMVWGGDRYFHGGDAVELRFPFLLGTKDPAIYNTARVGEFTYDIPVKPGLYELRLHFAESAFGPGTMAGGAESSRVFTILLGGQPLLSKFDVLSEAGGNNRAFTRVFEGVTPGSDGMVHLTFDRIVDQPFVNAIELLPARHGWMNPVRIVMQDNPFVDHDGHLWAADEHAFGGMLTTHRNPALDSTDPHLYDGERFGNFSYQIPVAKGHYTVTLHFTESYFGTELARLEDGDRLFDVYANGTALLRNFNILEKAGGPNRPVTQTFHRIEPNAAGLIVLSFVPVHNYACLDAIEVIDESH